jgi:hypothetical protein
MAGSGSSDLILGITADRRFFGTGSFSRSGTAVDHRIARKGIVADQVLALDAARRDTLSTPVWNIPRAGPKRF